MANSSDAAIAITALGQTFVGYSFFLPPLREVRQAARTDSSMQGDVRLGEFAATSLALAVGMMLSQLSGSSLPIYTSLVTAAILIGVYEYALQGERVMEK